MSFRLGRPRPVDLLLAAGITVIVVAGSTAVGAHAPASAGFRHLGPTGYLPLLAAGAGLAWRRVWPTSVLVWVLGWITVYNGVGYPPGPSYLPLIVAFCTAIIRGDRRIAYAVLAAGYANAVLAGPMIRGQPASPAARLGLAAWLLVLAAVAEIIRIRAAARRAEARQAAQAAEARREQARRRTGEERLRIAQDLHDVLAHQLALITVQANAGLAVLDREPDRAGQSLRAIKDAGNTALGELRLVLDTLRTAADGEPPRRPAPLLGRAADLDRLVDGAHAAGLRVTRETCGTARRLPGPVDQAGYRIVQEALTNAVRHAGPGTAVSLRVDYRHGALRIVVSDDGRGTPDPAAAPGGGNGLPGMRERAASLGGTLEAGPTPDGGFRVAATLPTGEEPGVTSPSPGGAATAGGTTAGDATVGDTAASGATSRRATGGGAR